MDGEDVADAGMKSEARKFAKTRRVRKLASKRVTRRVRQCKLN